MILDGVFGSQAVDSSGEILDVDGADVTDLEEGKGVLNYEHKGAEDKTSNGEEIVGKILTAKKIFKESDCDTARQRKYWNKLKLPFIYGVCRLYDGAGHAGAKALAAQIRDHHANDEPILVRFSVEGSTLEKDGNVLKRSVIRRVALTLKPCNKTAESGLVEDPHAPEGFEKEPESKGGDVLAALAEDSKKFEHPGFTKLGGVTAMEYSPFEEEDHAGLVKSLVKLKALRRVRDELKKALTAGGGDVAPSQLTGMAALAREDLRKMKGTALNVLKSYLKGDKFDKSELRGLLKQQLPEASDEFIDHFADIADDYVVKLRKDEKENPFPQPQPHLGGLRDEPRVDRSAETPGGFVPSVKNGLEMKPGGKLLMSPPGGKRGARRIALQQHFPNDEAYHALLRPHDALAAGVITDEQHQHIMKTVHEPWHRAMAHWLPLNKALSEGKVPKGILAKSVIFAAMSPNTSVPMQERYYGHWMDMLHEGKVDPFRPISEKAIQEFTKRSVSGRLPVWNRDYYEAHPIGINAGGGNEEDDSPKGELPQILGLRNAHKLYPYLEHLTSKYKDDTQGISAELMAMKEEHKLHDLKVGIDRRAGRDIQRQPLDHEKILGFGPKLTRYMLGMYGGGNMIVPDRHMVRSTFDLELEDPRLEKLITGVVSQPKNEKLFRAIDHNFFTKHPAVRQVLETFPKHFQGREQQALFPAFWLHWLTIGHHDKMRGRPSMAANADTDHGVFWDSVRDEMIKHGLHPHPIHDGVAQAEPEDTSFDFGANIAKAEKGLDPWPRPPDLHDRPTWLKAAGVVQALAQRWGENPALLAFFSHIVPALKKAETPVPPVAHTPHPAYTSHLFKAESLLINLKKAFSDGTEKEHPALREVAPHVHHVYALRVGPDLKIRRHPAGRFLTAGNHVHLLEDYHGDLGNYLTEGPLDAQRQEQIAKLYGSHKFDVAPLDEIMNGSRPELWEPPAPQKPTRPPSVFEYQRHDQDRPDLLEFKDGAAHLNGSRLTHEQARALMGHLKDGHALVRYSRGAAIQKMEQVFERLFKADGGNPEMASKVHEALGRLDELVKLGHLEPHHAEALRAHAFKDPMTGHVMGNKFAHTDFLNRADAKGGIHIVMDGNDFKSVNDKFGHEVGDQAIKSMGTAMREAMDESVGREHGKLFRVGGDEFAAHVPTHEHAAKFARTLRSKLEKLVPIQGTHKLSMGIGIGHSHEHADRALYEAKKQKYHAETMNDPDSRNWVSKYAKGAAPTFAHSLVPGFEGAIPLHDSQLHVTPPPAPQPKPPPPAPVVHTPPAPTAQPSAPAPAAPGVA